MSGRYNQGVPYSEAHFSQALFGTVERSRMILSKRHETTFNAGDIVPIYCCEMLPREYKRIKLGGVIRQNTVMTPTMGNMFVDFYAFFVPNRVVNHSTASVFGENVNGAWVAPSVSYAPLKDTTFGDTAIPVGSVADYYGFPTQAPIPNSVLAQCHDLKFRGYVEIYNEYFRDQNYEAPLPYSKLNVFEGFLDDTPIGLTNMTIGASTPADNSVGAGAVKQAVYGNLGMHGSTPIPILSAVSTFKAFEPPLKANKLHDYFTSGLPSPQKSNGQVFIPISGEFNGQAPVYTSLSRNSASLPGMTFAVAPSGLAYSPVGGASLGINSTGEMESMSAGTALGSVLRPDNLYVDLSNLESASAGIDISAIRSAFAAQQLFEQLARGGSRYRSYCKNVFGIEVDDPYKDIPVHLGHMRRQLDLYQTAQTSASGEEGSTPQGNLAAFGYTQFSGDLLEYEALEHGYLHIFAVVRHTNVYPHLLGRDNFRLSLLDYYHPSFANISEQPIYTKQICPFGTAATSNQTFAFQEAWAEYRYENDEVSGLMRPGVAGSLALWNYADDANLNLSILTSDWLKSNSQEVLDRSLAVTSAVAPQFKGQFVFEIVKELPMPSYSVPGMDII